jgi:osmotically-inducible protein OsmY
MNALAANRRVHADEIAVQAIDGAVILRGTVGRLVQEADTGAAVLAALIDDEELQVADIEVTAHDGTVTLSGLVESPGHRDRAKRVALGVAGVSRVDNRLKVLVPVSADELESRISRGDGQEGQPV